MLIYCNICSEKKFLRNLPPPPAYKKSLIHALSFPLQNHEHYFRIFYPEEKLLRADGIMIMHQNFSRVSHGVKLSQQLYCRFTIYIVAIDYDTGKFSHGENNITTVWYHYGFLLALNKNKSL